jgi:hypothetical protein
MAFKYGLIGLLAILVAAPGPASAGFQATQDDDDDPEWPHEIITESHKIVLYQPQLDSLEGDTIVGRCAASVKKHADKEPVFGTVWIKSRMITDRAAREVTFAEIDVTNVKFPKANEAGEEKLAKFLEEEIPRWGLKTSLERIAAAQELLEKEQTASDKLKTEPPQILRRTKPAALVLIDGNPILAEIQGTPLKRVVNIAMFLVQDTASKKHYLFLGDRWGESVELNGPWTRCAAPPAAVSAAADQDKVVQEQKKAAATSKKPAEFPEVIVVTKPTELIVFEGEEKWGSIAGTELHYVTNTDAEIFRETGSGKLFYLASGRWYTAGSFDGPWEYVAADKLPGDFQKIPPGHEVADVRASVAGTDEAKEAILDAKVPQTAAVKRPGTKVEVVYDGEPKWEKVEGLDIQYALNTAFAVFQIKGKYYCCHNATWYDAPTPKGPWALCTKVPEEIYSLPPSCPHYNVKYVYVYEATTEYVYVGYTPGYTGSYIYGPTVVYGTGWWYAGWWGAYYWPRACTWGVAVHYNCVTGGWGYGYYAGNPWYGCAFGWTCAWAGWVAVGLGGACGWWGWHGGGDINIDIDNINFNGDRVNHRNNNVYNRRQDASNRLQDRPRASQQPANRPKVSDRKATGERNNVLSDRDGNVYRKDSKQGWQQRDSATKQWQKQDRPSAQQRQLERNQQSRQRSVQRTQQHRSYSGGGGSARRGGGGGRGGGGRR